MFQTWFLLRPEIGVDRYAQENEKYRPERRGVHSCLFSPCETSYARLSMA
jgi:hypothetical protein